MSEKPNQDPNLRDAGVAAEQRPVPSQAEGEVETVEQDLEEKEKSKTASSGGQKS